MSASEEPEENVGGFTLWAVMRRNAENPAQYRATADNVAEVEAVEKHVGDSGIVVRGWYDVSGLKADADIMVWLHGPTAEGLQSALRAFKRTALFNGLLPTWNVLGVHRGAEFNRAHVPGFMRGERPRRWLTLYPFVRSTEWYLLPPEQRSAMLAAHGRIGASHQGIVANTVSAFALGDYEWILPMEADELVDLVDLMRDLRATEARRHMREETPFYTGRRIEAAEILEILQ